ncbi:hypothetical protein P3T27_005147 [Kitasatospora sp. MAA19]|uniref:hypothetical protein n=1 Tax=Kitasatospora sp. MAA19 TaxID=3035090 RepID=UPI002473724F|nr:hypothetical protein [Kitasatospora sp. MAA19]MDH6708408.1 hypothetical protein [Kitasatospora sp. MAA19]
MQALLVALDAALERVRLTGLEVAVLAALAGALVVGVGDLAALVEADGAVEGALLGVAGVDRERDDVPVLGDVGVGLDAVGDQGSAVGQAQGEDVGGLGLHDGEAGVGRDVAAAGGGVEEAARVLPVTGEGDLGGAGGVLALGEMRRWSSIANATVLPWCRTVVVCT